MISRVAVVVPAKDEERLLPACLRSLQEAVAHLGRDRPDVEVDVLVVLDGCVDGSAAAAARQGMPTVACDLGRVGAVRHLGAGMLLAGAVPEDTWLLSTDADSTVPGHWLTTHIDLAEAGADVVVGTVEPVGLEDPAVLRAWRERHVLAEGHGHVHGANLGVRASTYLALGGFAALALDEDVDLVRRARGSAGVRVVATDQVRVRSSARRDSRCTGGFGQYLLDLESEVS